MTRIAKFAVGLALAWMLGLFALMLARMNFPLELEWMEGGTLHQAQRLVDGAPIYAEPSVDFVPFLYTPLYPALVAAFGKVFGVSYALARGLSIACALALCLGLRRAVANELAGQGSELSQRWRPWLAPGLFCAGYIFCFRWLDTARADACFLALATWGLVFLRAATRSAYEGEARRAALKHTLAAGVCLGLAFWAKQTAALFIVAAGLWTLRHSWRLCVWLVLVIGLIDGVGVLLGQALTDGWLWTYIYELHQSHAFNRVRFLKKTWGMFGHAAPFLALLLAGSFGQAVQRRWARRGSGPKESKPGDSTGLAFWGLLFAAAMLASALGYSTQWAEPNAFLPGVALGAVFCTLLIPREGPKATLGLGLVISQMLFAVLLEPVYQPVQDRGLRGLSKSYRWQQLDRSLPRAEVSDGAKALASRLRVQQAAGRRLLAPQRPWWGQLHEAGGGRGHVGSMGLNDVPKAQRSRLRRELRAQLTAHAWDDLWFEGSLASWWWLRPTLAKHYRLVERREGNARVLPMVGFMSESGMVAPYTAPQLWLELAHDPVVPEGEWSLLDFEFESYASARSTKPAGYDGAYEREGQGFGRAPARSIHRKLPAVGPISGARLASSAASGLGERGTGTLRSPSFVLPMRAQSLSWRAGSVGSAAARAGLSARLVNEVGDELELEVPGLGWRTKRHSLALPEAWRGQRVYLRLEDRSAQAALFIDDLRASAQAQN